MAAGWVFKNKFGGGAIGGTAFFERLKENIYKTEHVKYNVL